MSLPRNARLNRQDLPTHVDQQVNPWLSNVAKSAYFEGGQGGWKQLSNDLRRNFRCKGQKFDFKSEAQAIAKLNELFAGQGKALIEAHSQYVTGIILCSIAMSIPTNLHSALTIKQDHLNSHALRNYDIDENNQIYYECQYTLPITTNETENVIDYLGPIYSRYRLTMQDGVRGFQLEYVETNDEFVKRVLQARPVTIEEVIQGVIIKKGLNPAIFKKTPQHELLTFLEFIQKISEVENLIADISPDKKQLGHIFLEDCRQNCEAILENLTSDWSYVNLADTLFIHIAEINDFLIANKPPAKIKANEEIIIDKTLEISEAPIAPPKKVHLLPRERMTNERQKLLGQLTDFIESSPHDNFLPYVQEIKMAFTGDSPHIKITDLENAIHCIKPVVELIKFKPEQRTMDNLLYRQAIKNVIQTANVGCPGKPNPSQRLRGVIICIGKRCSGKLGRNRYCVIGRNAPGGRSFGCRIIFCLKGWYRNLQ